MTDQELREKAISEMAKAQKIQQGLIISTLQDIPNGTTMQMILVHERAIRAEELLREAQNHQRGHAYCGNGHEVCSWCKRVDAALNGGAR